MTETGLSDPEMKEARIVLEKILTLHAPYPAMLVDRNWDIVLCNKAFEHLVQAFAGDYSALKDKPWNLMRMLFHPDGWAPNVANLASVYATMMERGRRSLVAGDSNRVLTDLLEEITQLRPSEHEQWEEDQVDQLLAKKMRKATDAVVNEYARLTENLDDFRQRWTEVQPDAPELPVPTLRTAATVVAVGRTRATAGSRGVWP